MKTAVEFLELHLLGLISFDSEELRAMYKERITKAKEIEKQQIIDAYGVKVNHSIEQGTTVYTRTFGEEYYNATYKKKK